MGFFDKLFGGKSKDENTAKFTNQSKTVLTPLQGKVLAQADIPDETFAQGILGPGCGIEPTGDTVYAPFDGTVTQIATTLHAVGITSNDGIELLIHVGMDTVDMKGQGFTVLVKENQKVTAGTPLLKVDLDAIRAVAGELPLIEDCAQAHGAAYKGRPAGSTGTAGTFSFYPTKNLGAVGDGGCVVTSDDALAERIRSVREYGWRTHYLSSEPGINTRLDELQAAFLNVLLPELPAKNAKRRALAEIYRRGLSGVPGLVLPTIPDFVEPVYHLYVVQCPDRDEVQRRLRDRGVGTAVHYPFPVHLQDAYRGSVALAPDGLPVTEAVMPRILSLPMYPELSEADAAAVAGAVRDVVSSLTKERA